MEIKKILVPISFAPSCEKAMGMAVALATAFGAKLYVMNVYRATPRGLTNLGGALYAKDVEQQKEAMAKLDKFVKDELYEMKARLDVVQLEATGEDPVGVILDVAAKESVDMIVLGHHEESKLEHILFGRDVDRIVEKAPCDVLVTRTPLRDGGEFLEGERYPLP